GVVQLHPAGKTAQGKIGQAECREVSRRHLQTLACQLRRHTVEVLDKVGEASIMKTVVRARDDVFVNKYHRSRFKPFEPLRAGVYQCGKAANCGCGHEIGKVHQEAGGFQVQPSVEESALESALDAARSFRLEKQFAALALADSEVDGRRFESVAIIG